MLLETVTACIVCYSLGVIVAHIRSISARLTPQDWSREDD
jgi:hypothetical protein